MVHAYKEMRSEEQIMLYLFSFLLWEVKSFPEKEKNKNKKEIMWLNLSRTLLSKLRK